MATDQNPPAQRVYDKIWQVQRSVLSEALEVLDRHGVVPIVFKGAELTCRFYGHRAVNAAGDFDILVDRKQLGEARRALYLTGFRQASLRVQTMQIVLHDLNPLELAMPEARHYELYPFRRLEKLVLDAEERWFVESLQRCEGSRNPLPPLCLTSDGRALVCIECDVHHGVSAEFESGCFFERAIPSALGRGLSLSPADHLWFLTNRLYWEVGVGEKHFLRDFAFLAALASCPDLDWDIVIEAARELDIRPSLYYYLTFINRLTGGVIPSGVLQQLSLRHGEEARDWGWQLGRLFDIAEPCPIPLAG